MNVIVCGAGEVGFSISRHLSNEDNTITVIDHDKERLEKISNKLDIRTLVGYASHPNVLSEAGLEQKFLMKQRILICLILAL